MGIRWLAAVVATLLLVTFAAQATVPATPGDNVDKSTTTVIRVIQRAFDDARQGNVAAAAAGLDKALQLPGFDELPEDTRYQATFMASLLASEGGDVDKAHALAVQATGFAEAGGTAWLIRMSSAFATGDYRDAADSVTNFAKRWPTKLGDIVPAAIVQLHSRLKLQQDDDADRLMLDELFDADWQLYGTEPSYLWRDLALQHLQRGDVARATEVVLRVTSGQVALSMLVDKRFDAITQAHPGAFDVDSLIAAEIAAAEARIEAHPDRLRPITDLQVLYLVTRQYPKVLSISDAVVARVEKREGPKSYADFSDQFNWILDYRSRAFARMGQWDKAIATEELAARVPESGGMNVSQSINLGLLYAELGHPDNAATAIVQIGEVSPLGQMQLDGVKLRIAVDRNDEAAASAAMSRMRAHKAADPVAWQDALLLRGQLDEVASQLIERLDNPSWRSDALIDMQRYADIKRTPMDQTIHGRWNTVVSRPDVQAALRRVGRIEQVDIAPGLR